MTSANKSRNFFLIILPDVLLFYVSLWIAVRIRYGTGLESAAWLAHFKAFTIIFALWLVVFFIHGLFEIQVFRRYSRLFFNLVSAMAVNLLLAIIYFYFQ